MSSQFMIALLAGSISHFGFGGQLDRTEMAEVRCPTVLGIGVSTDIPFCDVLIQQEASLGAIVMVPPGSGDVAISFNLHNRHTYSEEETRNGSAYAEYTAEVAVASLDGEVFARRFVLSEFRSEIDLIDRIGGGAGPTGVKAVAPVGSERVFVTIPEGVSEVSIVGQSLDIVQFGRRESVRGLGRPVAVISDVRLEYGID
jgi:hypothetical protein